MSHKKYHADLPPSPTDAFFDRSPPNNDINIHDDRLAPEDDNAYPTPFDEPVVALPPTEPMDAIALCYYPRPDPSRREEFLLLVQSAGFEKVAMMSGRLNRKDAATYITKGRLAQLIDWIAACSPRQIFFDAELSGIQLRNLARATENFVADRTGLILDIFAQRARSQAGKLQVELARLHYQSTHLVREWTHLERQRGGIGVRGGPGEKQIELDRRMIADKIRRVEDDLQKIAKQRQSQRKSRQRHGVFTVALVGYTNAGKSTLFNALTHANALAKDQLFASLDPMARKFYLPDMLDKSQQIIAMDTVGFVRELPHGLVEAFHATLEETRLADLLLIVNDATDPHALERLHDVEKVLQSIGSDSADTQKRLLVWNKTDKLDINNDNHEKPHNHAWLESIVINSPSKYPPQFISALTGEGLPALKKAIADMLQSAAQSLNKS